MQIWSRSKYFDCRHLWSSFSKLPACWKGSTKDHCIAISFFTTWRALQSSKAITTECYWSNRLCSRRTTFSSRVRFGIQYSGTVWHSIRLLEHTVLMAHNSEHGMVPHTLIQLLLLIYSVNVLLYEFVIKSIRVITIHSIVYINDRINLLNNASSNQLR